MAQGQLPVGLMANPLRMNWGLLGMFVMLPVYLDSLLVVGLAKK